MLSISNLFEVSPVEDRLSFAEERMSSLKRAFKAGRISASAFQRQMAQYRQMKAGTPSRQVPEGEIKAAGTFLEA